MKGVPIVGEEGEGNACGKATKGAARKASAPCKGKSVGKGEGTEKSRRKRGSICS